MNYCCLIDHLAWPVTTLALAFIFRGHLLKLINRLKKAEVGNYTAEFDDIEADKEKVATIENAIEENDISEIQKEIGQPALRLLLALSGREEKLPLGLYRNNIAKRRIIKLGLADYDGENFEITELGLNVVKQEVQDRLNRYKK